MLDHILASQQLAARVRTVEAHNEGVGDEAPGTAAITGSSHAPLVAEFAFD
jgi:exonuclease III